MYTFKTHNKRIIKWNIILSLFNFIVVFRQGNLNIEAGYLSKNFNIENSNKEYNIHSNNDYNIQINLLSIEEIKEKQYELDYNLIHLPNFEIYEGCLLMVSPDKIRRIIVYFLELKLIKINKYDA